MEEVTQGIQSFEAESVRLASKPSPNPSVLSVLSPPHTGAEEGEEKNVEDLFDKRAGLMLHYVPIANRKTGFLSPLVRSKESRSLHEGSRIGRVARFSLR